MPVPICTSSSEDGSTLTIYIRERFGFNDHRDFREAYRSAIKGKVRYIVDLTGVPYLDSSALGMLLKLRDYAGGYREAVTIRNACPAIKEILRIASFHTIMQLD